MSAASFSSPAAGTFQPVRADGLPVFRRDRDEYATFYAPGCLCVVGLAGAERFEATIGPPAGRGDGKSLDWGTELWRRAESAVAEAEALRDEPFRPECLTLYPNNECNLQCEYCYADPSPGRVVRLDLATVAAAAEQVSENCQELELPFHLVVHGGGEPALHRHQVESILDVGEQVASRHQVEIFRYIATNGVMSEAKAAWLAHRFDVVGLSCDGPADIHDRQRPNLHGEGTLHVVERTAHILREEGTPFHVRATITGVSLQRQAEIATYLAQLCPEEIRFEPVYRGGRTERDIQFNVHQADEFVAGFLEARKVAQAYGVPLSMSGSRPGSVHGPHCNVFRQVLNLVPGGVATACFKAADASQAEDRGVVIGRLSRETGRFEVDVGRVQALRQQLDAAPPECAGCFNRYHCVRECPDYCPLDRAKAPDTKKAGFRCRVQKWLIALFLEEKAERLWSEVVSGKVRGPHGSAII